MIPFVLNLWHMNGEHSAVVQAVATSVGVPILGFTLFYTMKTLRVAGRQAEAAENAANLGIQQLAQNVHSQDKATEPVLTLHIHYDDPTSATIRNVGFGPAFGIKVTLAAKPERKIFCPTDILGAGQELKINFCEQEVGIWGIRIAYKSAHERPHECTNILDGDTLEYVEQHNSFPCAIDKLWDERFKNSHAD